MDRVSLGPRGAYHTRLLQPPDLPALQGLFERAADYFELATGQPPARDEAERAFVAGPPSKAVHDKRVVGVFAADGVLAGVLDALTDWPEPGTWSIGALLLDPAHRGAGLGNATLAAFESWAAEHGATRLRTAVVAHDEHGLRFLEGRGFAPETTLEGYEAGGRRPTVVFLRKAVSRGKPGAS